MCSEYKVIHILKILNLICYWFLFSGTRSESEIGTTRFDPECRSMVRAATIVKKNRNTSARSHWLEPRENDRPFCIIVVTSRGHNGVPVIDNSMVCSTVCSCTYQRKHHSSASLFWNPPVTDPYKGPVTRKMFAFHDVIMMGEC